MAYHPEKFKALVHYICKQCHDPEKLSWVKLHKILWYSDSDQYVHTREPITGETYIKEKYGPFATHLSSVVNELVVEGRLYVRSIDYHDYEKGEFTAKGDADIAAFSERELRIINENIKSICESHTATSISEKSHTRIWQIATEKQPIPYQALLVSKLAPITEEDMAWAKAELKRLHP